MEATDLPGLRAAPGLLLGFDLQGFPALPERGQLVREPMSRKKRADRLSALLNYALRRCKV